MADPLPTWSSMTPEEFRRGRDLNLLQQFRKKREAPILDFSVPTSSEQEDQLSSEEWARFAKESPVLAEKLLADPSYGGILDGKDDPDSLSYVERWLSTGSGILEEQSLREQEGRLQLELADLMHPVRLGGELAPASENRRRDINAQLRALSAKKGRVGYLPRFLVEPAGQVWNLLYSGNRMLTRAAEVGAAFGVAGAVTGPGAAGAAAIGATTGAAIGAFEAARDMEAALALNDFLDEGMDLPTARAASHFVGWVNGGLEGASDLVTAGVARWLPWVQKLGGRELARRIMRNGTARKALLGWAGRAAESAVTEYPTEFLQSVAPQVIGAIAQDKDVAVDWAQAHEEGTLGFFAGGGMGAAMASPKAALDLVEAPGARAREQLFTALHDSASRSQLRAQMPQRYRDFVDEVVARAGGGVVENVTAPADQLQALFQADEELGALVAEKLPEVARQIEDARRNGQPNAEVTIPTADFSTYFAASPAFHLMAQDLRVGDELTVRERAELKKIQRERMEKSKPAPEGEATVPTAQQSVYADLVAKAEEAAVRGGREVSSADRLSIALIAANAEARAARRGEDAWTYYQRSPIQIAYEGGPRSEVQAPEDALTQPTAPVEVLEFPGALELRYPGQPLNLSIAVEPDRLSVSYLSLGMPETVENRQEVGGKGFATALYLRALSEAQKRGLGFASDMIRSDATERMYERLRALKIPVKRDGSVYSLTAEEVKALNLDAIERENEANAEIQGMRGDHPWVKGLSEKKLLQDEMGEGGAKGLDGRELDLDQVPAEIQVDASAREEYRAQRALEGGRGWQKRLKKVGAKYYRTFTFGGNKFVLGADGVSEVVHKGGEIAWAALGKIEELVAEGAAVGDPEPHIPPANGILGVQHAVAIIHAGETPYRARLTMKLVDEGGKAGATHLKVWKITAVEMKSPASITGPVASAEAPKREVPSPQGKPTLRRALEGVKRRAPKGDPSTLRQPEWTGGARGFIQFPSDRAYFRITLTGKANFSTFLHESGHLFYELLERDAGDGVADARSDLALLRKWLGVEDGAKPSVEQLEKFARGFEAYLMEGKAPSVEMQGLFATFSAWLGRIYKELVRLNAPLTEEVRGVMGRLLATEDQLRAAQEDRGLAPVAGDDPSVAQRYADAINAAVLDAGGLVERNRARIVQEEEPRIRAAVEAEANADPVLNAVEWLRTGKRLDGMAMDVAGRLDMAAVDVLLEDTKKRGKLTRLGVLVKNGGLSPDDLAPYFGFENGLALLNGLLEAKPRAKWVSERVEETLLSLYPELGPDGMKRAARAALSEGRVAEALAADALALARKAGMPDPLTASRKVKAEALRLSVRDRVAGMRVRDLDPSGHRRAERAAQREATEAYSKQDWAGALAAQEKRLWHHLMASEMERARQAAEDFRGLMLKWTDDVHLRRLGKAGDEYVGAIEALAQGLEFRRQSDRALDRRAKLAEYLQRMEDAGQAVVVPPELRGSAHFRNYRDLTSDEVETMRGIAENVIHLAGLKNKLRVGRELRSFQTVRDALVAGIRESAGWTHAEYAGQPHSPTTWGKAKAFLRFGSSHLKKIEFLCRVLDGGVTAGPVHQALFEPFSAAEVAKVKLQKEVLGKLQELFAGLSPADRMRMGERIDFLGTPLTRAEIIAVALNMGNEGNEARLLGGYAYRGWSKSTVLRRLDELLSDRDLELIQGVWDTIDTLWPEIARLEKEETGKAPEKVEASPVEFPSGRSLRGGYYPVVKDKKRNTGIVADVIAAEDAWESMEGSFMCPSVASGFTKARGHDLKSPILLDLGVIPRHLNSVIHYLTHYQAVKAADRLISDPEFAKAIKDALSVEYYDQFRPWLQGIARDGKPDQPLDGIDRALKHMRNGAGVSLLGFKVTTGLLQALGLLTAAKEIGPTYVGIGMARWLAALARGEPFDVVGKESEAFQLMDAKFDRDISQAVEEGLLSVSLPAKTMAAVGEFSMGWIQLVQRTVNAITWLGAAAKAADEQHANPVAYADATVRLSQSAGGVKDLAAIQRGGEAKRLFVVLYTYFNVLFNQLTEEMPKGTRREKASAAAARYWWLVLLPVTLEALARGRKPKDDDEPEEWAKFFAREQILYASRSIPFVSTMAEAAVDQREARMAPWVDTVMKAIATAAKGTERGRLSDGQLRAIVAGAGTMLHLPSGALNNAVRYVRQFQEMEDPVRNLLFRSPADWE